jgi:LuxR family maltose regulon positive regulatory protein
LVRREHPLGAGLWASSATIVVITAPAGYGKTTTLAQLAASDPRPTAFLSISRGDNDAIALIGWLTRALNSVEDLDSRVIAQLTSSGANPIRDLIPPLRQVLAQRTRPFVLMLDNVDRLHTRTSNAVIEMLMTESVANCYQLVMAGRTEPPLDLARWQANGDVDRIGVDELRMSSEEGAELLRAANLALDTETASLLVQKTEGWPGGLYLAALALRGQDDPSDAAQSFAGDDRLITDYVRSEFLNVVSPEVAAFLIKSAVLDTMCGDLCDVVLERSDSTHMLSEITRSNLLVIPLDRRGEWHRYHRLLRDVLLSELHRQFPEHAQVLHARASEWYQHHGDHNAAISHAKASGDTTKAAALVWAAAPACLGAGLTATVAQWLELFTADEIERSAALAVTASWWALTAGDIDAVDRWALVVELMPPGDPLPDGTPVRAAAALLAALIGTRGLTRMRDDAAQAYELEASQSPYRTLARVLEGAALRLLGDERGARERLEDAVRLGRRFLPTGAAQGLGQLALLALQVDDLDEAIRLVEAALQIVDEHLVAERPAMGVVFAAAAIVHGRCGRTDQAREESKCALRLLAELDFLCPWATIEGRILIARAELLCGETATARDLVAGCVPLLRRYPDSGSLPAELESVIGRVDGASMTLGPGATPLTPAEARVLRQLPTHLSFGDIADSLFVSRNTIKTQAIAVYRKLGVTSRAAAVEKAREIGLIDR